MVGTWWQRLAARVRINTHLTICATDDLFV